MQSLRTIILTFLIAWRFSSNIPISKKTIFFRSTQGGGIQFTV